MVLEEARPYLTNLASLAPKLNEATDHYMEEMRIIESKLAEMHLGIEVELDKSFLKSAVRQMPEEEYGKTYDYQSVLFLGYGKVENQWCIFAADYEYKIKEESWSLVQKAPLLSLARDVRIAAAEQIPSLLQHLEKVVKEKIADLQKVTNH